MISMADGQRVSAGVVNADFRIPVIGTITLLDRPFWLLLAIHLEFNTASNAYLEEAHSLFECYLKLVCHSLKRPVKTLLMALRIMGI